jgi:hypothetical protein
MQGGSGRDSTGGTVIAAKERCERRRGSGCGGSTIRPTRCARDPSASQRAAVAAGCPDRVLLLVLFVACIAVTAGGPSFRGWVRRTLSLSGSSTSSGAGSPHED